MLKNVLSVLIISQALLQGPYIYYYASGFMSSVIILPYMLLGIILSLVLLYLILAKKSITTKLNVVALLMGIFLGSISLFAEDYFEKIDWHLRKPQRNQIINQIKNGKIKYDVNKSVHHLIGWYFPPISNAGNDIMISKSTRNRLTVVFYINRGFLDHYSAFVYTDDLEEIKSFENRIQSKSKNGNYRIGKNWYRLNY